MGLINTSHLQKFATGFEEKARALFAKKTDIPDQLPANGGDASTVNGHSVNADVPENANFSDTKYNIMGATSASAAGKSGLVPAPGKGKQNSFLRGDGTWGDIEEATDADIDAIIAGTFK